MVKVSKLIAIFLVLVAIIGFCYCRPKAVEAAEYTFKLSHEVVEGGFQDLYAKKLKEYVEKATNGRVQIQIFMANQLGDPISVIESIQNGVIAMGVINTGSSGTILKDFNIFNIPMLFPRDWDHLHRMYNSGIISKLAVNAEKTGIIPLGAAIEDYVNITANKPIKTPQDMKGLKIRVMNSPILIATYQALGASPTPIPFSEVYSSLQLGMVEAQENPFGVICEMAYYEVQKYLTTTKHYIPVNICWMNKKIFDSLPKDIQKAFIDGGKVAQDYLFEINPDISKKQRSTLEKNGMKIIEPDKSLIDAFAAARPKAEEEYIKIVGEETGKANLDIVKGALKP